jgi:O-antigen/teichoic acid export membrane protein
VTDGTAHDQEIPTAPAEGGEATATTASPPVSHDPNLARIAVRSTLWVSLGTYLNQLIGFGAVLAMTRILSPEVFGLFSLGTFWSSLLNLRPKVGLNYAAIRQTRADGDLLGTYLVLDVAVGAASLMLAGIAGVILRQLGYANEVVAVMLALIGFECVSTVVSPLSMVLEKELQISRLTLVSLVAAVGAYGTAIYLALNDAGIWSLLAVNGTTATVSLIGVYIVCRRRFPQALRWRWHFSWPLAHHLLRQGLPTGLSLAAQASIVTQFDNFLIGTFAGYATLGFYDRAYRIAHWPNILLTMIVSRIGFLTFAKVKDDPERLAHAVRLSLWVLTTLGTPIALISFFSASDLVQLLYGGRWSESAVYLRFLTIYSLVWPFISIGFWLSVALGHTGTTVRITVVQSLSLVLLGTPLTLVWGVAGTLVAVGVSMALGFGVICWYMFRQVSLSIRTTFGPPVVSASVAATILTGMLQLPGWDFVPLTMRLLAVLSIGAGAFWLTLLLLQPTAMRMRIQFVLRHLRKRPL